MAKVIFFDDIDFGLLKDGSDEVSTSGKWLDNGIYFTTPKSENNQSKPHHIAHDSYIYTLGSNVTPGEEYTSDTTDSNTYISVISGISADPFKKEITYNTTKYDLSKIFEELSNMKQDILDILGRLNGQETVSSFTFSLSRANITDTSLSNFVVGEPIEAKIISIIPSSAKYSYFNIIESDGIKKLNHDNGVDEDACYFTKALTTSVSTYVISGTENTKVSSTIDNVTASYAAIYTYAYSYGVRIAGLNNVNINADVSLRKPFGDIHNKMFDSLKNLFIETDNIAQDKKKLEYYYNVNSYKVYYNNSYVTTTSSLLTYAIKQQNTPTFINTSVDLNVKAYLVSYTVKTEKPTDIGSYTTEKKYAYITDITNATVDQYLGRNKTSYTCYNTNNKGAEITGGIKVASLPFTTNKPHRKDILITYTLVKPSNITVTYTNDTPLSSPLNLNVGDSVDLKATLNRDSELHNDLKGISISVSGNITVNKTSITSGETIKVTVNSSGSGSITFRNSKITNILKQINITVSDNVSVSRYIITDKLNEDGEIITTITPLDDDTTYGINLLAPRTIKTGDVENPDYKSIVSGFPLNDNITNNYFATKQKYSIYILNLEKKLFKLGEDNEENNPVSYEERNGEMYYMIKSTQSASQFNGEEFYIQID